MKRASDDRHRNVAKTDAMVTDRSGSRWLPEGCDPCVGQAPREALRYLVVDDIDEEGVFLISYMWPSVTEAGTLLFAHDSRFSDLAIQHPGDAGWRDASPGMAFAFEDADNSTDIPGRRETQVEPSVAMSQTYLQETVDYARVSQQLPTIPLPNIENAAEVLLRSLRIGDTFALVTDDPKKLRLAGGSETLPVELARFSDVDLYDITRQAREAAKAAQFAALTAPAAGPDIDEEIDEADRQAAEWEKIGDEPIRVIEVVPEDRGADSRDAQPTV